MSKIFRCLLWAKWIGPFSLSEQAGRKSTSKAGSVQASKSPFGRIYAGMKRGWCLVIFACNPERWAFPFILWHGRSGLRSRLSMIPV